MESKNRFEKEIVVQQYDCDVNRTMKASALLRHVQQISIDHCDALGITAEQYEKTHTVFLLAKLSVDLYDKIPEGSLLKLVTRACYPVKAVYHRYTDILDEHGTKLAFVDAHWILVDTQSKRILRKAPEELNLPFGEEPMQLHEEIPKIPDAAMVKQETIRYSQVDLNHHLNNTSYIDIICDLLPMDWMEHKEIKKILLHYHHEILWGETMDLYLKHVEQEEESGWYSCGLKNSNKVFEAWLEFE